MIAGRKENSTSSNYATYLQFGTRAHAGNVLEHMRIASDGNVKVNTGNLVIGTSGKGIDFSATSDATGKTSELLDDYEEGTYSCPLKGTTSGSMSVTGNYVRIGKVCHINFSVLNAVSSSFSGNLRFEGLPFDADVTHYTYYPFSPYKLNSSYTGNHYLYLSSATHLSLNEAVDNGDSVAVTASDLNGTYLRIQLTYFIA
jgi:hypothetical protein